jgi:hypothetical protein
MAKRKMRVRKHVIADMSLYHLAFIVASCTFTIEPTRADYGYDLSVFTFDGTGAYENGNIFVQLKATDKLRTDRATGAIKFRISKRDILTWESEPFPAYLVVFDAAARKGYGVYLQRYGLSAAAMAGESIEILLPPKEIDETAVQSWRTAKNSVLTQMGAITHV